jgi:adenylate cyclase
MPFSENRFSRDMLWETRSAAMSDIQKVLEWLAGGALSGPESQDVLAQLCERLVDAGIPLWRAAVFVTTLHPDVMGRRFLWQAESGVTVSNAFHSLVESDDFRKSPFTTVLPPASRCAAALRMRIAMPNSRF